MLQKRGKQIKSNEAGVLYLLFVDSNFARPRGISNAEMTRARGKSRTERVSIKVEETKSFSKDESKSVDPPQMRGRNETESIIIEENPRGSTTARKRKFKKTSAKKSPIKAKTQDQIRDT